MWLYFYVPVASELAGLSAKVLHEILQLVGMSLVHLGELVSEIRY